MFDVFRVGRNEKSLQRGNISTTELDKLQQQLIDVENEATLIRNNRKRVEAERETLIGGSVLYQLDGGDSY